MKRIGFLTSGEDAPEMNAVIRVVHTWVLWFNPALPAEMDRLHMHIRFRGHSLET